VSEGWVNVNDARAEAERKLEPGPRGYFSGGAGDEVTMRDNVTAWQGQRLLDPEGEVALASLGVASPADLGPGHLRSALPTRVYSG
jgi:hypothetical protein